MTAPQYLSYYTDALTANGVAFDVYDVDAHGRTAPDDLGVLSHYDAVVWYTGDDVVTREPGWGPGNASRLAMQELLEVRDFVNEGGRVLYTGQRAGQQYTPALGTQLYDPFENKQCRADPAIQARCLALSGSGNSQGDPIEYLFGAAITTAGRRPRPGHRRSVRRSRDRRSADRPELERSTAPTAPRTRPSTRRSSRPATSSRSPTRPTASRSSRAGRRPST